MIRYLQGNLLESDAEAWVNPVNTVGVMGAGLARTIRQHFPVDYQRYVQACSSGELTIGKVLVTLPALARPKYLIHFPTKRHCRNPSQMRWIVLGLKHLCETLVERNIQSVAIPALGCGLGGLQWCEVRCEIECVLCDPNVDVQVFEPLRSLSGRLGAPVGRTRARNNECRTEQHFHLTE